MFISKCDYTKITNFNVTVSIEQVKLRKSFLIYFALWRILYTVPCVAYICPIHSDRHQSGLPHLTPASVLSFLYKMSETNDRLLARRDVVTSIKHRTAVMRIWSLFIGYLRVIMSNHYLLILIIPKKIVQ